MVMLSQSVSDSNSVAECCPKASAITRAGWIRRTCAASKSWKREIGSYSRFGLADGTTWWSLKSSSSNHPPNSGLRFNPTERLGVLGKTQASNLERRRSLMQQLNDLADIVLLE